MITAILLHKDNLYSFDIQDGQLVSVGSDKKDNVLVPDFASGQIVVKRKGIALYVNAKKAYGYEQNSIPMNTIILLNGSTKTALYFCVNTGTEDGCIELPTTVF